MKKIFTTLVAVIAIAQFSYAQWQNGTNIYNTNSGYVGIGTTSPSFPLHVNGAGYYSGHLSLGTTYNSFALNVQGTSYFISGNTYINDGYGHVNSDGTTGMYPNSTAGIIFKTGSSEKVRIDLLGNVGIGTTTPLAKFVVAGDYNNTGAGGIMLDAYPTSPDQYSLRINPFVIGSGKVGYQFQTKDHTGGTAIPLTFDNTGNVGIGTTTPGAKLQINSPAGAAYAPVLSFTEGENPTYGFSFLQDDLTTGDLQLNRVNAGTSTQMLTFQRNTGYVGIGTTTPHEALSVNGNIRSKQVKVETNNWPDYVFSKEYILPSLFEVKTYIDKYQHLPDMPSEAEVAKEGLNLGDVMKIQTKKIEELTLYLIEKDKQVSDLQSEVSDLKKQIEAIAKALNKN